MKRDPFDFIWVTEDVARPALHGLRRRARDHVVVGAVAYVMLVLIGAGWAGAFVWMMGRLTPGALGTQLAGATAVFAGCAAWSVVSVFQRGVLIALSGARATQSLREAVGSVLQRAPALVALAVVLAAYDLLVLVVCGVGVYFLRGWLGHFALALGSCCWCFAAWMATRSVLGMATANIVVARETVAAALRNSTSELRAYRIASLASRAPLVPGALGVALLVARALTRDGGGQIEQLVLGALLLPLMVSCDGALEAGWYDHLRGVPDAKKLAAIFE